MRPRDLGDVLEFPEVDIAELDKWDFIAAQDNLTSRTPHSHKILNGVPICRCAFQLVLSRVNQAPLGFITDITVRDVERKGDVDRFRVCDGSLRDPIMESDPLLLVEKPDLTGNRFPILSCRRHSGNVRTCPYRPIDSVFDCDIGQGFSIISVQPKLFQLSPIGYGFVDELPEQPMTLRIHQFEMQLFIHKARNSSAFPVDLNPVKLIFEDSIAELRGF